MIEKALHHQLVKNGRRGYHNRKLLKMNGLRHTIPRCAAETYPTTLVSNWGGWNEKLEELEELEELVDWGGWNPKP
jgi:hypothetical protein